MKGKMGWSRIDVPEDTITHVWRTHIPTLSIVKLEVESIYYHKLKNDFSLILKPYNGKKYMRVICQEYDDKGEKLYRMKNMYHLTEADAYKRLISNFKTVVYGTNSSILIDDKELLASNWETFKDKFPELVV